MFAVIKTGGKQYRVQEGDFLEIEKIQSGAGQKVAFDQVLLIDDGEKTLLGTPFVANASVRGEVVEIFKAEKVIVFKKKRRKQYRRTRGHRQPLTRVRIEKILTDATGFPLETGIILPAKPESKEESPAAVTEKAAIAEQKKTAETEAKPKAKPALKKKKAAEPAKEAKPKKEAAAKKIKGKKPSK